MSRDRAVSISAHDQELLRPEVQASWTRSELAGLHPDQLPEAVQADFDRASRLLDAADPVMSELHSQFSGHGIGALLADRSATIVSRYFGNEDIETSLDRAGVHVGMEFTEENAGTNAISTPFETRTALHLSPSEHYLDDFKKFTCYGVPLVHPLTRRLEGVVDLMVPEGTDRIFTETVLLRAAKDIQHRILSDYDAETLSAFALYDALRRRSNGAVVLIADDFRMHNDAYQDLVSRYDEVNLNELASDLEGKALAGKITLSSGLLVDVHSTGANMTLLHITEPRHGRPVPRGKTARLTVSKILQKRVEEARRSSGHVAIVGEHGSGRTSVARALCEGADVEYFDCSSFEESGAGGGFGSLCQPPCDSSMTPVIIDNIDVLSRTSLAQLSKALKSAGGRRFVLTSVPADAAGADVRYLLSMCADKLEVTPLRHQLDEFDEIAATALRSISDSPTSRLTAPVLAVLKAHPWDGNFVELVAVLRELAQRRPIGDIVLSDVPHEFKSAQSAPRRYTALELATKRTIEEALRQNSGNKVHTAKQLAISRSTLYKKLQYFRLV